MSTLRDEERSFRSANLDRKILVEKQQRSKNATYNTNAVQWVPLAGYDTGSPPLPILFNAQVMDMPPSKSEENVRAAIVGRKQVRIRMRYRSDVDSSMRITVYSDGGKTDVYQIIGGPAMVGGRKQRIELLCEEFSS